MKEQEIALIPKLPYGKGLGSVVENPNEENERYPLPTDYIRNILTTNLYGDWNEKEELLYFYLLGMIGLTTGMRNSEIARLQRKDIIVGSLHLGRTFLLSLLGIPPQRPKTAPSAS